MRLKFFLLFLIIISSVRASDSLRVILFLQYDDGSPITWLHLQVDSINDNQVTFRTNYNWDTDKNLTLIDQQAFHWDTSGQVISNIYGNNKTSYTYSSQGKLISEVDSVLDNGIYFFQYRKESYQNISGNDSLKLEYDNSPPPITLRKVENWFYDSSGRIVKYQKADNVNGNVITKYSANSFYPDFIPTIQRVDSIFEFINGALSLSKFHVYDSLSYPAWYIVFDSHSSITDIQNNDNALYFYILSEECGYHSIDGSIGHSASWDKYTCDSKCRIATYSKGAASYNGGSWTTDYYYYANYDTMILFMNKRNVEICRGDSVNLKGYVFGGTPPYTYSWNHPGILTNDTSLNTIAFPNTDTTLKLTITDANGFSITDSVVFSVSYLPPISISVSNIDTINACSSVTLDVNQVPGVYYSWQRDGEIFYPTTYPSVIATLNDMYTVFISSGRCFETDSVQINFLPHPYPECSIDIGCNQLFGSSSTATFFEWTLDSIIVGHGREIDYSETGSYFLTVSDSNGCKSDPVRQYAVEFELQADFHLHCDNQCNDTGNVQVLPYPDNHLYLWSNGATTNETTNLCGGLAWVTVTNQLGCVLTAGDTCPSFQKINPEFKIYPLPFTREFNIETYLSEFPYDMDILDLTGRKLFEGKLTGKNTTVHISFRNQFTLLRIMKGDEILFVKKLITY